MEAQASATDAAESETNITNAIASLSALPLGVYTDKAALQAALIAASLTNGNYYVVLADETVNGASTRYRYVSEPKYTNGLVDHGRLDFSGMVWGTSLSPTGFPQGVIGYWRARDYVTSIGGLATKCIPNLAAPANAPAQAALSRLPSGAFKYAAATEWTWLANPNSAALVMTDAAEIGPFGQPTATSVVGTGGDQYVYGWQQVMPASQITFAVWLRSRTGVNQSCRISANNGTAYSTVTVTPVWQRFTVTATLGATQSGGLRIANDGTAAWDIAVDHAIAYAGATAPADVPLGGHLYFGLGNAGSNTPTVSSGWIDLSPGGPIFCDFEQAISSREFTVMALVKCDALTAQNNYIFCAQRAQNAHYLRDVRASANDTEGNFKGALDSKATAKGLLNSRNITAKGAHVLTVVARSNKIYTYIDDVQMSCENLNASPAETALRLWRLNSHSAGLVNDYDVNQLLLARRAFTPAEVRQAFKAMLPAAALDGITVTPPEEVVCFEGDSLPSFDSSNNSWCDLYLTNHATKRCQRRSITGSECATGTIALTSRAGDVDSILPPAADRAGRKFVLAIHIGTNDMMTISDTTFMTNLNAYIAARQAAGWKLCINTLLARNGQATYNTRRALANTSIRALASAGNIAIADIAGNANIGDDADAANTTYFNGDGIHLNATGHTEAYPIIRDAINSLW